MVDTHSSPTRRYSRATQEAFETGLVVQASRFGGAPAALLTKLALRLVAPGHGSNNGSYHATEDVLAEQLLEQFKDNAINAGYVDFRKSVAFRYEQLELARDRPQLEWFATDDSGVVNSAIREHAADSLTFMKCIDSLVVKMNNRLGNECIRASCYAAGPRDAAVLQGLKERGLQIAIDCCAMTSTQVIDREQANPWADVFFAAASTYQLRQQSYCRNYRILLGMGVSRQYILGPRRYPWKLRKPQLPTLIDATGDALIALNPKIAERFRIERCQSVLEMHDLIAQSSSIGANAWMPWSLLLTSKGYSRRLHEEFRMVFHDCCFCNGERFGDQAEPLLRLFREAAIRQAVFLEENQLTCRDILKRVPGFMDSYRNYGNLFTVKDAA